VSVCVCLYEFVVYSCVCMNMHVCICMYICQLWKSQWLQLHAASSRGPVRLEKYSSQAVAQQSIDDVHKPVPLTHLQSVKRLTVDGRKQAIEVSFSAGQEPPFMFCPDTGESQILGHSLSRQYLAWLMQRSRFEQVFFTISIKLMWAENTS